MIIGLTDRPPAPPQLGTLRKGAPKPQNGNGPGKDLEYFRFDCDDAEVVERFAQTYGPEPTAIRVFVPFATAAENFDSWREEWTASSLQHRCDGETMVLSLTPRGTYSEERKPCPYLDRDKRDKGCKQVGRLKVIVRDLKRFAIVVALTTSEHDIRQIHANLLAIESLQRARGGNLCGVPLILKRSPKKISTPAKDGKRARREKWLLSIEAEPEWAELQFMAMERAALPQVEQLALPAWDGDDEEETLAEPETDSGVVPVSDETFAAIQKLWSKYGQKLGGKVVSFADYVHQKKGIASPRQLPQEDAVKMLGWLQEKALAVEPKPETVHQGEIVAAETPAEEPKADQGSGLDQWRCTRETKSRRLAMDVLNATKRLEAAGVTETEWRAELNDLFHAHELPVSRKSLSAEEVRETWLPRIEGWAATMEAKK